ncbi:MAG TPA: glycosyltransferase family 2 protein [Verrucomicrobiae bacterium]|jgi:hypothetical protein|nr:glycosyltransferase family 2 protein [Verrucomicrobiae bacterium]
MIPAGTSRVAAHLIVGANDEPFLGALLASLEGAVQMLIVNDNAPDPSPHAALFAASAFARRGALHVDRTPFVDFATARNVCLREHRRHDAGDWIAFVDADEVHGESVGTIARRLDLVPRDVGFVDGYTWHFWGSFDWYLSIERRMAFFRYAPDALWEGPVHEQLRGVNGRRVALPYVYAHYGHVLPPRRHAEKGRLYSDLGQAGEVLARDRLDDIDIALYFRSIWPNLLRFNDSHPPAAGETIARLRQELAEQFATVDAEIYASQSPLRRTRNRALALNYASRWRGRALDPLAQKLMAR